MPQVILDFEPPAEPEGPVRISRYHKERDYFDYAKADPPAESATLAKLFKETALKDHAWRRHPSLAQTTAETGLKMWSGLPQVIRDAIRAPTVNSPRRLAILRGGTAMDDVPWEWLNAGPGEWLAAVDSIRLVRLVPTLRAIPALTVASPLRVLVIVTDAAGGPLLKPKLEIGVIAPGLKGYELRVLEESRLPALREALLWSPHVVHYVGHGGISGSTGHLFLHNNHDGTQWVSAAEFARMLPASVRLLCLSTCVSAENYEIGGLVRVAHCPPEFALPTTIVNQYAVTIPAAEAFWHEFYCGLATSAGHVLDSFHGARVAAQYASPDTACWASFALVLRDGTEHPLRIVPPGTTSSDRFAIELEAQWAARHANNLALRMRTLQAGVQQHWQKTLAEEVERVESFERGAR